MLTGSIYALLHPVTRQVFYIGETRRTLEARLGSHIKDACLYQDKSPLTKWIWELLTTGKSPVMKLLETLPLTSDQREDKRLRLRREREWLKWSNTVYKLHNRDNIESSSEKMKRVHAGKLAKKKMMDG